MRATLTLDGKPRDVQAIVGLALEHSILVSFTTDEHEGDAPAPKHRVAPDRAPFADGTIVAKKHQTSTSPIPRFSTGRVTQSKRQRGGWSSYVSWDEPSIDDGWIRSSALTSVKPGRR